MKSSKAFDPSRDMSPDDIAVDSTEAPTRMYVRIKASKTDQMRQGVTLVVGGTGNDLCPIAAMLLIRGREEGPLFRWKGKNAVTREDAFAVCLFFVFLFCFVLRYGHAYFTIQFSV